MSNNSFKELIKRANEKLKIGCQKIPKKTRIILVIIFLLSCGLFSLYQTISSVNQMRKSHKVQTEQEVIQEQSEKNHGTEKGEYRTH